MARTATTSAAELSPPEPGDGPLEAIGASEAAGLVTAASTPPVGAGDPVASAAGESSVGESTAAGSPGDGAALPAVGAEPDAVVALGRGVAIGAWVGRGVGRGVGVGAGQLPIVAGGLTWSCGSYRKPSESPSWNTCVETPRLDEDQVPPFRATKSSQNLLSLVQQLGGNVAGSPSTWQTAALRPPKSTVLYATPESARTCSPVRLEPPKAMQRVTVEPSPCSTTRATRWLPLAASHVAAGRDQASAVIGTWAATATRTARTRVRSLSVMSVLTRPAG